MSRGQPSGSVRCSSIRFPFRTYGLLTRTVLWPADANFISHYSALGVEHRLVINHSNLAGDGFNHPQQPCFQLRARFAVYCRGADLIDKAAFSVWIDYYFTWMRNSVHRFVIKI